MACPAWTLRSPWVSLASTLPRRSLRRILAVDLAQTVQNIKIYRVRLRFSLSFSFDNTHHEAQQQCVNLSDRCTRLLIAYREKYTGLEGTEVMAEVDEIARFAFSGSPSFFSLMTLIYSIIERALRKAQSWSTMSRIRSFVCQSEIKNGLEQLYRDIETCAQQFSVS